MRIKGEAMVIRYNEGLTRMKKGLKRIENGKGFLHFGFTDSSNDYIYANYKDGKITVDTKHPWNHGTVLHFITDNPVADMTFLAEVLEMGETVAMRNEDVFDAWIESGRKYR